MYKYIFPPPYSLLSDFQIPDENYYRGLPVGVRGSGWLDKSKIRGKLVIHAAKSDEGK